MRSQRETGRPRRRLSRGRLLFPADVDAVGIADGSEQHVHERLRRATRLEDVDRVTVDEVIRVRDVFFFEFVDEYLHICIADGTQVTIAILQEEPGHCCSPLDLDRKRILACVTPLATELAL